MQLFIKSKPDHPPASANNILAGKIFTIEGRAGDDVLSIKRKIHEKTQQAQGVSEIPPEQQCLVINDIPMEDDQSLIHYEIQNEAVIYLERLMQITVRTKANTVDERTFNIRLRDQEGAATIGVLKDKIYEATQIKAQDQCLVLNPRGIQLLDDRSISEYNIGDQDVIDILSKIQVFVKNLCDKTYTFDVTPADSVASLRGMIAQKEGTPENNQRLVFAGKQLQEGQLLDYNIQRGSTIFIVERLPGGLHF